MLMRTDPFRELDRLTQQVFGANGTLARPSVMPMDAWRDGDTFHVEFDLPGINPDSIDLDVERNVVTVKAERPTRASDADLIAAERPRGIFSRQLILGDNLDTEHISASYDAGVLTLQIPVAEQAKPRKISITSKGEDRHGHQRLTRHGPVMPTTPATGDTTARTVDEQFLDLICSDADLLAAEFDTIITAEWPEPPPDRPAPRRWRSPPRRRPCPRPGPPVTTPPPPGTGEWSRQRSPPFRHPDPRQAERQVIATREPTRTR